MYMQWLLRRIPIKQVRLASVVAISQPPAWPQAQRCVANSPLAGRPLEVSCGWDSRDCSHVLREQIRGMPHITQVFDCCRRCPISMTPEGTRCSQQPLSGKTQKGLSRYSRILCPLLNAVMIISPSASSAASTRGLKSGNI